MSGEFEHGESLSKVISVDSSGRYRSAYTALHYPDRSRLVSTCAVTVDEVNDFLVEQLPFCVEMRITCVSVSRDVAVVRFSYSDRWTRPGGMVCGPVLTALADAAVYFAIFTRLGIVPLAVTNELKANFLRPAIGRDVVASATLHKIGRRVAYASVALTEEHNPDRLIAHATASYVLPDVSPM